MMYGFTASGKSTLSKMICENIDKTKLIHSAKIRQILKLTPEEYFKKYNIHYNFNLNDKIFVNVITPLVYKKMLKICKTNIVEGYNTILDASYSQFNERTKVYKLIQNCKVPFLILHTTCSSEKVVEDRLKSRSPLINEPLNEAAKWETYISLKKYSDNIDNDKLCNGEYPLRIIIDTHIKSLHDMNVVNLNLINNKCYSELMQLLHVYYTGEQT